MATKKVYFGSLGPHLYEDTDLVDDTDGLFAGETRQGLMTNGQLYVEEAPSQNEHVVRWLDALHAIQSGIISATDFIVLSDYQSIIWPRRVIFEGTLTIGANCLVSVL